MTASLGKTTDWLYIPRALVLVTSSVCVCVCVCVCARARARARVCVYLRSKSSCTTRLDFRISGTRYRQIYDEFCEASPMPERRRWRVSKITLALRHQNFITFIISMIKRRI